MNATSSGQGPSKWLLLALPFVAQLGFVGLGAAALQRVTDRRKGAMDFYDLPQALLIFASYVVFGVATLLVARRLGPPCRVLAVNRTPLVHALGLSALALIIGIAAAAALEPIFHGAASQKVELGVFPGTPAATVAIIISFVTVIGGAAITEELYFRGLLLGAIDGRLGAAAAITASAGVFGLVHFQPAAFPTLFALGLVLGVLRVRTRSVWPGIGVHAANNGLALTAVLLAASSR